SVFLVPCAIPSTKNTVCIGAGDIAYQELRCGNLVGDLLHQLLCDHLAVTSLNPNPIFLFKVFFSNTERNSLARAETASRRNKPFRAMIKRSIASQGLLSPDFTRSAKTR